MASQFQCPKCGAAASGAGALGQTSDQTIICSGCGHAFSPPPILSYAATEKVGKRRNNLIAGAVLILLAVAALFLLMPSRSVSRSAPPQIKCAANMKDIGLAIAMYAGENKGFYPPRLESLITDQEMNPEVFVCQSTSDTPAPGDSTTQHAQNLSAGKHLSYIYIGQGLTTSARPNVVVMYEPPANHGNGCNVLFADGHVEFIQKSAAGTMISQLQAGQNPPPVLSK